MLRELVPAAQEAGSGNLKQTFLAISEVQLLILLEKFKEFHVVLY